MARWPLPLIVVLLSILAGCTSGMQCGPSSEPDQREQCVSTGGPVEAAGTAVAAGVAWGAVGCRVNGCHPPYVCNEDTGMCERMPCGEGRSCLAPYECNLLEGYCE